MRAPPFAYPATLTMSLVDPADCIAATQAKRPESVSSTEGRQWGQL